MYLWNLKDEVRTLGNADRFFYNILFVWLWICTEQKFSVTHVIVTWMINYNWDYSCAMTSSATSVGAWLSSKDWMLKPLSKGSCKHNVSTFERFLFYSKPPSHCPATCLPETMMYPGKISLSTVEQPKEDYISKNTSRGLFTVKDEISDRKSLQFCLGFCLFGCCFWLVGWFWDFLLGVQFFCPSISNVSCIWAKNVQGRWTHPSKF